MTEAVFTGDMDILEEQDYDWLCNHDFLLTALSLPKKFGSPPEEILIGVKEDKKGERKRKEERVKYESSSGKKGSIIPLTKFT
jgi:hypothetical protein